MPRNVMPDELKFEGDKPFFTAALDRADADRARPQLLRGPAELAATQADHPDPQGRGDRARSVQSEIDPVESGRRIASRPPARLPALHSGTVAIIGGPVVFGMFMDRYDVFWLSEAPHVRLPGGEPCFPGVPAAFAAGDPGRAWASEPGEPQMLDPPHDVSVTPWRRGAQVP